MFIAGFVVRLYRFNNPVADWHAFRQGDTNAVSVIYVRDGINLLYPRFFDLSNVATGIYDDPKGYRFVEFPIYNALQAALFQTVGGLTIVEWGRIISIFSTLFGAFFVYLLTKKYANETAGFFAAFFYLFLPFSIFYGRTVLPNPSTATAILAGIYFFDKWLEKFKEPNPKSQINTKYKILNTKYFLLSVLFTAIAFLLRPFAIFFTLPIIYLAFKRFEYGMFKKWELWLFALLCLVPLILWRWWIGHYPEGIPQSDWLFNGNNIRFHPAFFYWIFYERITKLILGFAGVIFLLAGLFWTTKNKNGPFFVSFVFSSLFYVTAVATGNIQHDYYQISIIPTISMICGLGVYQLFTTLAKISSKLVAGIICSAILIICLFFSWYYIKDFFNINDWRMVTAGEAANKILPADAVVIAPYDNSTTFLNIIGRPGWPVFENDIETLIHKGATYLVIAAPTKEDFGGFGKNYQHVAESKDYLILKLR